MPVIELHCQIELQDLLKKSGRKLVVVCFTSGHCGPCRTTTPRMEAMSNEMPDVVFAKIDVKKADEIIEQYQITGVPAFFFFRNGCEMYKFQGGNADFLSCKVEELRFKM